MKPVRMAGHKLLNEFDEHELIVSMRDKAANLRAFVAIHSTRLGPATGGTRYWHYKNAAEALQDALRLSRAMSLKCAMAGVPFGGGKAVILAGPETKKDQKFLSAYARRINFFRGSFTTGEDVGFTEHDIRKMGKVSPYINGANPGTEGLTYWTVQGLLLAIESSLKKIFPDSGLAGRTFAVKGLGKIGLAVCQRLTDAGATLYGADIQPAAVKKAQRLFPKLKLVNPRDIHTLPVDVYCPCALGEELTAKTVPELRCKIICGGANSQLSSTREGERLHRQGILYVPDYVANAGGLIRASNDLLFKKRYNRAWVKTKVEGIRRTVTQIINISEQQGEPTSTVSDRLALLRIAKKP